MALEITDRMGDSLSADREVGLTKDKDFVAILWIRTKESTGTPCVGLSKDHARELYEWLGNVLAETEGNPAERKPSGGKG